MQGQNFTVGDAQSLVSFAGRNHLGRVSMWSINRDSQCGSSLTPRPACCPTRAAAPPQSGLRVLARSSASSRATAVIRRVAGNVQPAVAGHQPGGRALPAVVGERRATRSATRSSRTARSTRPSGTTAATTRRRRCSTPGRRRGSCSARCCPATTAPAIATLPAGTYPAWSVRTPSTRPATRCSTRGCRTRPSGPTRESPPPPSRPTRPARPWKALYGIPGEPSGAPAVGAASGRLVVPEHQPVPLARVAVT